MKRQPKPTGWLDEAAVFQRTHRGELRTRHGKITRRIVPVCVSTVRTDNERGPDAYLRVAYRREHPEICLTDEDGQFVDALVDGTYRLQTYLTCLNNPRFVEEALALVKRVMHKGADGVLIRYDRQDQRCHAHRRHVGYVREKEDIYSEIPWMEQFDERVLSLPRHRHLYPDKDQDYAFERFIGKVKPLVKGYGTDKVVILEANSRFHDRADGVFVKSLLPDLDQIGKLRSGTAKPVLVSSFSWEACNKKNLSLAMSMSWLYGFAYVVPETISPDLVGRLSKINRGKRRSDVLPLGAARGTIYENGVAVVNTSKSEAIARLKLPENYPHHNLVDLYTGRPAKIDSGTTITKSSVHDKAYEKVGGDLVVRIPARSGRLYFVQNH